MSLRSAKLFFAALVVAGSAVACDDASRFEVPAVLLYDTVALAVPSEANADTPSAVDITVLTTQIGGGRFPERAADADQWDFTLRLREGVLVLMPAGALQIQNNAGLTAALVGQDFGTLGQVPARAQIVTTEPVTLAEGSVHVARSRVFSGPFGGCQQFARLQAFDLDVAQGTARLVVATNMNCGDPRLADTRN
jgi:hypothetical protein